MRHIKVKFVDFWEGFDPDDCIFLKVLSSRYDVEICDDADYIIHSVFGDTVLNESNKRAVTIFYSGENQEPNFNISDYAVSFGNILYEDRFFRLPNYYFNEIYHARVKLME